MAINVRTRTEFCVTKEFVLTKRLRVARQYMYKQSQPPHLLEYYM